MNEQNTPISEFKEKESTEQAEMKTEISTDKNQSIQQIQSFNQDENESEQEISKQRQFNILAAQEEVQEEIVPKDAALKTETQHHREEIIIDQKQSLKQSSGFQDVNLCNFDSGDCEEILVECESNSQKDKKIETNDKKVHYQSYTLSEKNEETNNQQIGQNQKLQSESIFIPENVVEILKQFLHDSQLVDNSDQSLTKQYVLKSEGETSNKLQGQKIKSNFQLENEIKVSQLYTSLEESQVRSPNAEQVQPLVAQETVQNKQKQTNSSEKKSQQNEGSNKQELVGFKVVVMLISIVLGYRFFSWVSRINPHQIPNLRFYLQIITASLVGIFAIALITLDRSMKRKRKAEIINNTENGKNYNF